MCPLPPQDQHVCQSHHGIAEAVTGVLGSAQFPSCSFYHPRSTSSRFRSTRKAAVCPGNFSDSNGISDDCKRQKRSYSTEPVPAADNFVNLMSTRARKDQDNQRKIDTFSGEFPRKESTKTLLSGP